MVASYPPDVQAEIDRARARARASEITGGNVQFPDTAPVADNALLTEGNLLGAMTQSSDPGSRDKITLYSTETGLPSQVLVNMLEKKLVQKLPNGKPAWSETPTKDYSKCLLHEEHQRRSEWDSIGLAGTTCRKSNITSEFELRQHMLHRHRVEWQVIEEARAQAEKDEERAFRRMQMEQWQKMNEAPRRGRPPKEESEE
jgi:hypothetical protein